MVGRRSLEGELFYVSVPQRKSISVFEILSLPFMMVGAIVLGVFSGLLIGMTCYWLFALFLFYILKELVVSKICKWRKVI